MVNIMKKETMLEAFLRQSKIDPNSHEQTEECEEKLAEQEKIEALRRFTEQTKGAFSNKPISNYMEIPTQLESGELYQKTELSPQFKNYDHSLEENRWRKIGGKDNEIDDGLIQMEEI